MGALLRQNVEVHCALRQSQKAMCRSMPVAMKAHQQPQEKPWQWSVSTGRGARGECRWNGARRGRTRLGRGGIGGNSTADILPLSFLPTAFLGPLSLGPATLQTHSGSGVLSSSKGANSFKGKKGQLFFQHNSVGLARAPVRSFGQ